MITVSLHDFQSCGVVVLSNDVEEYSLGITLRDAITLVPVISDLL